MDMDDEEMNYQQHMRVSDNFFIEEEEDDFGYKDHH